MSTTPSNAHVAQLQTKIKSIRFAMLTTIDEHQHLISRPMTNQEVDSEGNLWFFTSSTTDLSENVAVRSQVNVAFTEPAEHVYVSVSGRAERVNDPDKIKLLWSAGAQAWFPNGPDDPKVILIKVVPHAAEYWNSHGNSMVQLFRMAKAVLTHTTPDGGEHGKIAL